MDLVNLRRLILFSAAIEAATGLALLVLPSLLTDLLFGETVSGVSDVLARFLGVALITLGLNARRPKPVSGAPDSGFALCFYNIAAALLLAITAGSLGFRGPLLWPVVLLHALFGIGLLIGLYTRSRRVSR